MENYTTNLTISYHIHIFYVLSLIYFPFIQANPFIQARQTETPKRRVSILL